jgi:hypothetical protein
MRSARKGFGDIEAAPDGRVRRTLSKEKPKVPIPEARGGEEMFRLLREELETERR